MGYLLSLQKRNDAFCIYRDPNLKETPQAYDDLVNYLAGFDADEREMKVYHRYNAGWTAR